MIISSWGRLANTFTSSTSFRVGTKFNKSASKFLPHLNACLSSKCKEMLLLCDKLTEKDFVMLWNLMPQNYDMAVRLVPGLKEVEKPRVEEMVNFLNEQCGITQLMGQA